MDFNKINDWIIFDFVIFFHQRVGIQNNPSLTWGGQYKNITEIQKPLYRENDEDDAIITYGSEHIYLLDPILPNSQYIVRAHVVDSKGCHGEDSNYTYIGKFLVVNQ